MGFGTERDGVWSWFCPFLARVVFVVDSPASMPPPPPKWLSKLRDQTPLAFKIARCGTLRMAPQRGTEISVFVWGSTSLQQVLSLVTFLGMDIQFNLGQGGVRGNLLGKGGATTKSFHSSRKDIQAEVALFLPLSVVSRCHALDKSLNLYNPCLWWE